MPDRTLEQAMLDRQGDVGRLFDRKVSPEELGALDSFLSRIRDHEDIIDLIMKDKPMIIDKNDKLAAKPDMVEFAGDLPSVRRPPSTAYRMPLVQGSDDMKGNVNAIMSLFPQLRNKSTRITDGPTNGAIDTMLRDKISPYNYDRTTLLGSTDLSNNDIFIKPGLPSRDYQTVGKDGHLYGTPSLVETLMHELTHAAGGFEDDAENTEKMIMGKR